MKFQARWLVNRQLQVVENGMLDLGGADDREDLGDVIIMPGLVNAHVHLDYTHMRGKVSFDGSFTRWIQKIIGAKQKWGMEEYRASILDGIQESLSFGTTAMGNWTCVPEVMKNLRAGLFRAIWFQELIDIQRPVEAMSWKGWREEAKHRSMIWDGSLAPHAPYTCTESGMMAAADWCDREKSVLSMHVAESREEWKMFWEGTGILHDFLKQAGRDMGDTEKISPLRAVANGLGSQVFLQLVHMNELDDQDWDWLVKNRKRVAVVHCPRSTEFFGHEGFSLEGMDRAGIPVGLGTDSLASNQDLSMFLEMKKFRERNPSVNPQRVVQMATMDGARSLGWGGEWGQWQDWLVVPVSARNEAEAWEAITSFTGKPMKVIVNGQVWNGR